MQLHTPAARQLTRCVFFWLGIFTHLLLCDNPPTPLLLQTPAARQLTHCVFLAYKSLANTAPSCRVWLDGARAVS